MTTRKTGKGGGKWDPMKHDPMYPDNCVPSKVLAFAKDQMGESWLLFMAASFGQRTKM